MSAFRDVSITSAPAIDRDPVLAIWRTSLDAEPWVGAPQWIHGDPHPANLIFRDEQLTGVN